RSARWRAHSPLSTVPDQREASIVVHLHPDSVRTPVFLYPHAPAENRHRTDSVSPAGKKTTGDLEPRGSESTAGSAWQSSSSHSAGRLVRFRLRVSEVTQLKASDID